MNYYINYSVNTGISIKSAPAPGAWYGDIGDLAEAVTLENEDVSCNLEGAKAALEDGAYWAGSNVSQEALEEIHASITEFEESEL